MRRLLAIGFVWLGCAAAWLVLGRSLEVRSGDSSSQLLQEVRGLWGPPRLQLPPTATGTATFVERKTQFVPDAKGKLAPAEVEVPTTTSVDLDLERTDIEATLSLEHRKKGLLWFPAYEVSFRATYRFRNPTPERRSVVLKFPLEAAGSEYDGFEVAGPAGPLPVAIAADAATFTAALAPGEARDFTVAYRSRGTSSWQYGAAGRGIGSEGGRARDFRLALATNVPDVDFLSGTLSPSSQERQGQGWRGEWRFTSILSGKPIGLELPQRLNPGPFAERLALFAPVSLLFFFFVVSILAAARGRSLHPMHYFLLGCAFFAFHLLFAYLIDHLPLLASFGLASAVSVLLAVTYTRHFTGWRFALRELGLSQLLYLVLFSASFFWRGWTGLAITIGAITTLFAIMQITGKLDWEAVLAPRPPPSPPRPPARPPSRPPPTSAAPAGAVTP